MERRIVPQESFRRRVAGVLHDLLQRVGEDEIIEVDRVDRGTVRTAMDSRLAEVDGLGALGLQLLVQDQNAVEPEPRIPFFLDRKSVV